MLVKRGDVFCRKSDKCGIGDKEKLGAAPEHGALGAQIRKNGRVLSERQILWVHWGHGRHWRYMRTHNGRYGTRRVGGVKRN